MRALPLLLILALAATPVAAQQKTPAPTPLRGPVSNAQTPTPAAPLSALPPLLTPLSASSADAGRCRLSCASGYYFCLSTDGPEDCAAPWGQCRARCDAPSPVQVISTIPGR